MAALEPGNLECAACETGYGWIAVLASPVGLVRLTLPRKSREEALADLGMTMVPENAKRLEGILRKLQLYFSGERVVFDEGLDIRNATTFQQRVWKATMAIPYGETRSYGWVAARAGQPSASRAVGQALGANPIPIIIPCHRVLAADGSLHGFSGGLSMKKTLLDLEKSPSAAPGKPG